MIILIFFLIFNLNPNLSLSKENITLIYYTVHMFVSNI